MEKKSRKRHDGGEKRGRLRRGRERSRRIEKEKEGEMAGEG